MEFCTVKVGDLVHDPENPRSHSLENIEAIRKSIIEHGQVEPLVVQKSSNMVIAGNARLGVMRKMGLSKVKVVKVDVDNQGARKLSISLNRSGELASWDEAILAQHLESLSMIDENFSPENLGFTTEKMEELMAAFGGAIESLDFSEPEEEPEDDDDFDDFSEEDSEESTTSVSNVRMVQLFFNDSNIDIFQSRVRSIAKNYGTENITDTVFKCIEEAFDNLED